VVQHRDCFSTITFLTKNPGLAASPEYLARLQDLMPCQVEVSLIFADEAGRQRYESGAPTVESRLAGIRALRQGGIPVNLRIDPLFPRDPLPCPPWPSPALADYGVPGTRTLEGIAQLVTFAAATACQRIIVSALKVPIARRSSSGFRELFRPLYAAPSGGQPRLRGAAYRLPEQYIESHLFPPVRELCDAAGLPMLHCQHNLLSTR